MANYNKKKSIGRTIALALCGVLSVTAVAGAGVSLYLGAKNNGWFEKTEEQPDDTATNETASDNFIVNGNSANGITLLSEEYGVSATSANTSYTLTASVTPSTATVTSYAWSIAWDTSFKGYVATGDSEDINGDGWIANISTADITDYVSLSSTSGQSVVLTCNQAFGNTIIVKCTVTSYDDSTVSATTTADYRSRVASVYSLTLYEKTVSSSTYSSVLYKTASNSNVLTLPAYDSERYDENYYSLNYTNNGTSFNGVYVFFTTGSVAADYTVNSFKIVSNSTYFSSSTYCEISSLAGIGWDDFCYDIFGYRPSSGSSAIASLYSKLNTAYSAGADAATATVTVTDNFTSTTTSYSFGMKINPSNLGTAATAASISGGSVIF